MNVAEQYQRSTNPMVMGQPEPICANFRAIIHLLAKDPLYGKLPLSLFPEVDFALMRGDVLCARDGSGLVSVACWKHLSDERARQCIAERRLPRNSEKVATGDAVLLTLIAGNVTGAVSALARATFNLHRGRIVLYERHQVRGQVDHRLAWVDKAGVRLGAAV